MKRITLLCLLLVCILSNSFGQIDSGLVFYLPCNGTLKDSTIYDRKPIANHQLVAPSLDRWGKVNSALAQRVNTTGGIQFRDSMMRSNTYTVSMWVNIDSVRPNGNGVLFNIGYDQGGITYGIAMYVDGLKGYKFTTRTTAPSPNSGVIEIMKNVPPKTGSWTHLFGTRDTNSMSFYINDTLIGTKTIVSNAKNLLWNPQDSLAVIFASGGQFITGLFDDVRIYNRVLSSADRHALFNFEKPASYIALNKDTIDVTSAATSQTVNITGNTSWTASSNQPWVTVNPISGNNNGTLTLTIGANSSGSLRNAVVTVTGTGAGSKTVYIRQQPAPADILVLNKDTLNTSSTAKAEVITVTSNRAWTVSSNQSWASVTPTSGIGNSSFTINITANSSGDRTATITATAGNIIRTLILNQAKGATFIDSLTLDKDSILANKPASTYTVELTSNTMWVATANQPWVSVTPNSGTGNTTLQVSVTANNTLERAAEMHVTAGTASKTVYITQEAGAVGLNELTPGRQLITFPNPVTDGVFSIANLPSSGANQLFISDVTGRMVSDMKDIKSNTELHIPNLKAGLYFLSIEVEGTVYKGKLLIH